MIALKPLFVFVLLALASPMAHAGVEWTAFSSRAFSEAQAAGRTIIVDVHADWCPTCKAQQPILDELRAEPALGDAVFMKVDFDREKDFLRAHRIARQSTILVFRGEQEAARSVAETNRERLRETVLSAARG